MISTAPTEWIVTCPLAFGRQALAPADTTIGNSKTFECDAGCAAELVGCATELKVIALKAIKPAAQDTGNVAFMNISIDLACGFREVAPDDAMPPPLSTATSTQHLLPGGQPKTSIAWVTHAPSLHRSAWQSVRVRFAGKSALARLRSARGASPRAPRCRQASFSDRAMRASFFGSQNKRSTVRLMAPAFSSEAIAALTFGRLAPRSCDSSLWEKPSSSGMRLPGGAVREPIADKMNRASRTFNGSRATDSNCVVICLIRPHKNITTQ